MLYWAALYFGRRGMGAERKGVVQLGRMGVRHYAGGGGGFELEAENA